MTDIISLDEREKRLLQITQNTPRLNNDALVQAFAIAPTTRSRLREALNNYLWACLKASFPDRKFSLTDDMLRDYEQDVVRLPNVTPNGLVLPKQENLQAFNLLQQETSRAFDELGFGHAIARVQYPVNVRLQSGMPDPAKDTRARASVKPHTDIWAGDPASGILVFLSLLGDPCNTGIRFFKPRQFPKSFVRTLNDYDDGAPLMMDAEELTSFDDRGWFLADPYVIHQTTKNGSGFRISLDFRFIPSVSVSSDTFEDDARKPFFMAFEEWRKLGSAIWIGTAEKIAEFASLNKKDPYTVGYPVKIFLTDAEKKHEAIHG